MAAVTPRIAPATLNLAIAAATVIDASSYDASFPPAYLRSATPSKAWRSVLGWNIVAGWNDKLDFTEAGVARVATLAAGNYATGALMAAQVQTAMNAAPGATNTYTVGYGAVTKLFSINRATGTDALVLKFAAGAPNFDTSVHPDLGYTSTDKSPAGAALATAEAASYKSREWVRFDLGSALAYTLGIAHDHNLGSGHTVKLLGKTTSNVWVSPGDSQTLAGDDLTVKRILFFASQSFRYVLLLFEDTGNTAGFTECGIPYVGTYFQPTRGFRIGRTRMVAPLSQVFRADQGAVQVLAKPGPEQHSLSWGYMPRADFLTWRAYEVSRARLFFAFDPLNYPGVETLYGVLEQTTNFEQFADNAHWIAGQSVFAEDQG